MLMITRRAATPPSSDASVAADMLILPFDMRSRSRFRATLLSGAAVGVVLERGQVLRGGDRLLADGDAIIEVRAADETVTTVYTASGASLARIAYHLGNRHVALQLGEGWLRYSHDHVLDDMVMGLGARITVTEAPFEPESGAYHGTGVAAHEHISGSAHAHHHSHDDGQPRP